MIRLEELSSEEDTLGGKPPDPPLPNILELRRGMTIMSNELSKCVHYLAVEVQSQ